MLCTELDLQAIFSQKAPVKVQKVIFNRFDSSAFCTTEKPLMLAY